MVRAAGEMSRPEARRCVHSALPMVRRPARSSIAHTLLSDPQTAGLVSAGSPRLGGKRWLSRSDPVARCPSACIRAYRMHRDSSSSSNVSAATYRWINPTAVGLGSSLEKQQGPRRNAPARERNVSLELVPLINRFASCEGMVRCNCRWCSSRACSARPRPISYGLAALSELRAHRSGEIALSRRLQHRSSVHPLQSRFVNRRRGLTSVRLQY
jgi:hypothetical protein